jgi:hypothetical protein
MGGADSVLPLSVEVDVLLLQLASRITGIIKDKNFFIVNALPSQMYFSPASSWHDFLKKYPKIL